MRQALIIIDVQQGLCEGPGAAFDHATVIARINTVSQRARLAGVPVIFVQHEGKNAYLTRDSAGWQLARGLITALGNGLVPKTTPDAFHLTRLEALLKALGISELIICGMHTEFCVDTSTRRAMALGFPVTLLADGHTSAGNTSLTAAQIIAHHNSTLSNISSFGPRTTLVNSSALQFSRPAPAASAVAFQRQAD
jgi:nicotinamidase-related amidase